MLSFLFHASLLLPSLACARLAFLQGGNVASDRARGLSAWDQSPGILREDHPTRPWSVEVEGEDSPLHFSIGPERVLVVSQKHHVFIDLQDALATMQSRFFQVWLGDWPSCSDWTAAVMSTHVSAALSSMSKGGSRPKDRLGVDPSFPLEVEDSIGKYFSQITTYYFGEDAFSIRQQAHDDMLWVVLGWLESIKFIRLHSELHHSPGPLSEGTSSSRSTSEWFGAQFIPAFAHRAHVFYDLVSRAWDTKLCGGGLTWNPSLEPYKNTITNTQFITASIAMYLYHPGDQNSSPFVALPTDSASSPSPSFDNDDGGLPSLKPHDPSHLRLAMSAYDWLQAVNLRNADGLYVDGFHISRQARNSTTGPAQCDVRNDAVYSYNQGVLLSGLRDLWATTAHSSYLADGHALVRNVRRATGWLEDNDSKPRGSLGHAGILEEYCDAAGSCNQDAQTFKGIFFHHLAAFCAPLPTRRPQLPNVTHTAPPDLAALHRNGCRAYAAWVGRNARAALRTRDRHGVIGGWWGVDPNRLAGHGGVSEQKVIGSVDVLSSSEQLDPNDRGRGRTVETQGSGLAVLRCWHELLALF